MTGLQRRDALWALLSVAYPALPPLKEPDNLLIRGLGRSDDKNSYLAEIFAPSDVLPPSRKALAQSLTSRLDPTGTFALVSAPRLFHRLGTCAKVTWTVGATDLGFTGLLAPAVSLPGVLRASLNSNLDPKESYAPGIALKLFTDDPARPTQNLLANHSFQGFPMAKGFLAEPLKTVLDPPKVGLFRPITEKAQWHAAVAVFQGALAWWRQRAQTQPPNPLRLDLSPMCAIRPDGSAVPTPSAPERLVFSATPAARATWNAGQSDDFRTRLATLPAGPLYEVFDGDDRRVATVSLDAPFVASQYGDETLFFHHAM